MQPTTTTIPAAAPWKPTRDQVRAAALAFARVSGAEWMKLPASSREDFLIDGHAALMAAHAVAPIPGAADQDVVCMSREHADAYNELFSAVEDEQQSENRFAEPRRKAVLRVSVALERLRSLTSPDEKAQ